MTNIDAHEQVSPPPAAVPHSGGHTPTAVPRIAILCEGVRREGFSEALKKEARSVYLAMRASCPDWDLFFVSVERDLAAPVWDACESILFLPVQSLGQSMAHLSPSLVHVFSGHLSDIFSYCLVNQRVLFTAVDSDPKHFCTFEQLEEIRHLIDYGNLVVVTESEPSKAVLESVDVRSQDVIYPGFELPPLPHGKIRRGPFTLGFASSPLVPEQWETRGVHLLLDLAEKSPETGFLVAWRGEAKKFEETVRRRGLRNIALQSGMMEMERFYDGVDAVLLPFARNWLNHGCPFSGAEALLRGKPVLATDQVGIAGLIEQEKVGIVVSPSVGGLVQGLAELRTRYCELQPRTRPMAKRVFDIGTMTAKYKELCKQMLTRPLGPSLRAWKVDLWRNGRELVKGRASLKAFYTHGNVARGYTKERFASFPYDLVDEGERAGVQKIVEAAFASRRDLAILDVATGEGRILRSVIPYGSCTAIDNSPAMLQLAEERAPGDCRFVFADFFDWQTDDRFDVITCFRLLRHFDYPDRRAFYGRIRGLLKKGGIAVVDLPSPRTEILNRTLNNRWEHSPIYDVFWTVESFRDELKRDGLTVSHFAKVGCGLHRLDELREADEPHVVVAAIGEMQDCPGEPKEILLPRPALSIVQQSALGIHYPAPATATRS